jgi:hypothetical protein
MFFARLRAIGGNGPELQSHVHFVPYGADHLAGAGRQRQCPSLSLPLAIIAAFSYYQPIDRLGGRALTRERNPCANSRN